jgi:hypothetical protein
MSVGNWFSINAVMYEPTKRQSDIKSEIYNAHLYGGAAMGRGRWQDGVNAIKRIYVAEGYKVTPKALESLRETIRIWLSYSDPRDFENGTWEYRESAIGHAVRARYFMCQELGVPNE